jgi:hypothetical protein
MKWKKEKREENRKRKKIKINVGRLVFSLHGPM